MCVGRRVCLHDECGRTCTWCQGWNRLPRSHRPPEVHPHQQRCTAPGGPQGRLTKHTHKGLVAPEHDDTMVTTSNSTSSNEGQILIFDMVECACLITVVAGQGSIFKNNFSALDNPLHRLHVSWSQQKWDELISNNDVLPVA